MPGALLTQEQYEMTERLQPRCTVPDCSPDKQKDAFPGLCDTYLVCNMNLTVVCMMVASGQCLPVRMPDANMPK